LAVDELLARTDSSGDTSWYFRNQVGSVIAIASTTAGVQDQITYDPFGNIVTQTNATNGDRFLFAGMEYDSVTGLYYDHARYYDAGIGRFVSQDPAGFKAGDTDLYRYVGNAPTYRNDPTGLQDSMNNPNYEGRTRLGELNNPPDPGDPTPQPPRVPPPPIWGPIVTDIALHLFWYHLTHPLEPIGGDAGGGAGGGEW
jgi:RHS repeat-associated protein